MCPAADIIALPPTSTPAPLRFTNSIGLPAMVEAGGERASRRFLEFFTAQIRNAGTRAAYLHAVNRFFSWCEQHRLQLSDLQPVIVATYIEGLTHQLAAPTVKVHLAAIKMLLDYLVTGHVLDMNPAASVRGPKHVVKKGKTPVLTATEARQLIDSIDTSTIIGLRDRALIGTMLYSFARVSAVVGMDVGDYYSQGRRMWFRLHEKGGKRHDVPCHHKAEEYVDAYLTLIFDRNRHQPLLQTAGPDSRLTGDRMTRSDALRMIKRRAHSIGLGGDICCHTFRATGITVYLENGGSLEHAQRIASHESARTTKLYDRTSDVIGLEEIERVVI